MRFMVVMLFKQKCPFIFEVAKIVFFLIINTSVFSIYHLST